MSFFLEPRIPYNNMIDSTQQGKGESNKAADVNLVEETKVFWSDGFVTSSIGRGNNSVWCNSVW